MMASSQVDIASSKNPFGCILKDHNHRDGLFRDSSARTPQNNLKELVRTRVRTRILVSPDTNKIDSSDNNKDGPPPVTSKKNSNVVNRWAAQCAQEMVSTIEKQNEEAVEVMTPPPLSASSSPSSSPPHQKSKSPTSASSRGAAASSLVQIWEARLGRSTTSSNCSNSPSSYNDCPSFKEDPAPHNLETLGDQLEPHLTEEPASFQAMELAPDPRRNTEKPRVADIIRRFISGNGRNSNKTASKGHDEKSNESESPPLKERNPNPNPNRDHDRSIVSSDLSFLNSPPHRLSSPDDSEQNGPSVRSIIHSDQTEQRPFIHGVTHSTNDDSKGPDPTEKRRLANTSQCPRIRGRQALKDLLVMMERDRKKELEILGDRKPVSRFTHKGRIQSLLKLKILQRGLALQDQWRPYSGSTQPHHAARSSALVHPREKFTNATDKIIKTKTDDRTSWSTCRDEQVSSASNPNNSTIIIDEKKNHLEEQVHQSEEKNRSVALQSESSSSCAAVPIPDVHERDSTNQEASSLQLHESSCATIDVPVQIDDIPDETSRASNATHQDVASNLQLHESSSPSSSSSSSSSSLCAAVGVVPAEDVREDMSDTTYQDANGGGADSTGVPESMESCYGWYDQEWTTLEGDQEEDQVNQDDDDDETLEMEEETTSLGGYEWFLGVSRPRSYWEDLRQSWYREMMAADSANTEIKKLLERRTVSNFLTSSDFQERMNNMMMTHLEEQTHRLNEEEEDQSANGSNLETMRRFLSSYLQQQQSQSRQNGNRDHGEEEAQEEQEEENEEEAQEEQEEEQSEVDAEDEEEEDDEEMFMRRQERMEEVMSNCLQVRCSQDIEEEDEDEEEEDEDEDEDEDAGEGDVIDENEYVIREEEEDHEDGTVEEEQRDSDESPVLARPYRDESSTDEYFHRNTRMMMRSLSCRNRQMNNNDHAMATIVHSRNPLCIAHSYYRDTWQPINSMDRLSMEMKLITDLREQMKQLHEEMSELRRSISNCVDVQVNLQDSIKQEISTVRGEQTISEDRAPRKGYCCICYDMKVDSFLYRCGHMCTCLKCAHELQQGSSKCPMCRAPILDVVRAYSDS